MHSDFFFPRKKKNLIKVISQHRCICSGASNVNFPTRANSLRSVFVGNFIGNLQQRNWFHLSGRLSCWLMLAFCGVSMQSSRFCRHPAAARFVPPAGVRASSFVFSPLASFFVCRALGSGGVRARVEQRGRRQQPPQQVTRV